MDPTLLKNVIVLVRFSIIAVGLLAGYLALYYVVPYLVQLLTQIPAFFMPFLLAVLMALIIEPLVNRFSRQWSLSRGTSVLLALTVVWGSVSLGMVLLVSRLVKELLELYRFLTVSSSTLSQNLVQTIENLQTLYLQYPIPPQASAILEKNAGNLVEGIQSLVQGSMNALFAFIGALPGLLIIFLIATISTYFISRDRELIIQTLFGWIDPEFLERLRAVIRDLGGALIGFIRAQTILISLTALFTILALNILGVKYALTLGLISGLLDILPILGTGALFIPWSLWEIAAGNVSFGCGLLVLYGIIVIVRQVIEPKIVADSIGLHPLATLLGMFVGLKALGFIGMIVGPVVLVLFQALRRAELLPFSQGWYR